MLKQIKKLPKLNKREEQIVLYLRKFYSSIITLFRYDRTSNEECKEVVNNVEVFAAIPMYESIVLVLFSLRKALGEERIRFIDVGAGKGNILMLARTIWTCATKNTSWDDFVGIEFNKAYCRILSQLDVIILYNDAFEIRNKQLYNGDSSIRRVFHIYQIVKDPDKLKELYQLYIKLMKSGDILIVSGLAYESWFKELNLISPGKQMGVMVYIKP